MSSSASPTMHVSRYWPVICNMPQEHALTMKRIMKRALRMFRVHYVIASLLLVFGYADVVCSLLWPVPVLNVTSWLYWDNYSPGSASQASRLMADVIAISLLVGNSIVCAHTLVSTAAVMWVLLCTAICAILYTAGLLAYACSKQPRVSGIIHAIMHSCFHTCLAVLVLAAIID